MIDSLFEPSMILPMLITYYLIIKFCVDQTNENNNKDNKDKK